MPYTPPSQRSPAASAAHSPALSRRSSYQIGTLSDGRAPIASRPELPRSASYLTRHRRTPSVKTATLVPAPIPEPTPPGTAGSEDNEVSIVSSGSLRQSPPPVTDDKAMPNGVVLSPPESPQQNSSDDEEGKSRGRDAETLAELQASLQVIGQHRQSSPNRQAEDVAKANQALTLIMPSQALDIKPATDNVQRTLSQGARKISHSRSNTDSSVYIGFDRRSDTPISGSEEDEGSDMDDDEQSRGKPPMLRKKSGELVRPALRPSSSRRRPSSMPGTPTFSKAVHFDSHLEHVRHFLQVDRPLAVSASSSPVDTYESDAEFPFNDNHNTRAPPFEWEISVSNFPELTPERMRSPVRVERVYLSTDNKTLIASVAVANISFSKTVVSRFTLDYWKTTSEVLAEYSNDVRRERQNDGYDRFSFSIKLADQANLEAKTMFFCVKYAVNGTEYWDNNNNTNFQVDFKKKPKPQNGKKGMQPAGSRPANGLPRSHKKSISRPPAIAATTFDDFADGFDSKYDFGTFAKKPVHDFLGESGPVRLKGVKSALTLSSDKLGRRSPNPSGQAFANRYDFGASLSAAISAANTVMGDKSGITMKPTAKKVVKQPAPPASITRDEPRAPVPSLAVVGSASGTDSPRPAGTAKPVLASDSYNELLDKYCFFGSVKSSPQLKDGTLGKHPGQFDGNDDTGYIRSQSPSPISNATVSPEDSPLEMKTSQPRVQPEPPTSPAPMTGFVTGTSPMYPYRKINGGFSFNEAHTPTAIRG